MQIKCYSAPDRRRALHQVRRARDLVSRAAQQVSARTAHGAAAASAVAHA